MNESETERQRFEEWAIAAQPRTSENSMFRALSG